MNHKIALITGGNRGLGRNRALKLAARGADIVFTYRSHAEEAQEVMKEIEGMGSQTAALQLDAGDSQQSGTFVRQLQETLQQLW